MVWNCTKVPMHQILKSIAMLIQFVTKVKLFRWVDLKMALVERACFKIHPLIILTISVTHGNALSHCIVNVKVKLHRGEISCHD